MRALAAMPGSIYQFERPGYFSVDLESTSEKTAFNHTVSLKSDYQLLKT